jgi:LysR family transcriptional regulator for metE and metH
MPHLERIHLVILATLAKTGSLTLAAEQLFLSQSALSHRIHQLEQKFGVALWEKQGRKLVLTLAGKRLIALSKQILPLFAQGEQELRALAVGRSGFWRFGVECYPCSRWLSAVLGQFLSAQPEVEVDVLSLAPGEGSLALQQGRCEVLIAPDVPESKNFFVKALQDYPLLVFLAPDHALTVKKTVTAADLTTETLLTLPVAKENLDVYRRFLWPAGVDALQKTVTSLDILLELVRYRRGIAVLPAWLGVQLAPDLPTRPLASGLSQTLYAMVNKENHQHPYFLSFLNAVAAYQHL